MQMYIGLSKHQFNTVFSPSHRRLTPKIPRALAGCKRYTAHGNASTFRGQATASGLRTLCMMNGGRASIRSHMLVRLLLQPPHDTYTRHSVSNKADLRLSANLKSTEVVVRSSSGRSKMWTTAKQNSICSKQTRTSQFHQYRLEIHSMVYYRSPVRLKLLLGRRTSNRLFGSGETLHSIPGEEETRLGGTPCSGVASRRLSRSNDDNDNDA